MYTTLSLSLYIYIYISIYRPWKEVRDGIGEGQGAYNHAKWEVEGSASTDTSNGKGTGKCNGRRTKWDTIKAVWKQASSAEGCRMRRFDARKEKQDYFLGLPVDEQLKYIERKQGFKT